ncbi:hypothetical protein M5D96_013944 [Drosophila gunungcola]|uniref:Uncharacterized protein n=1 Tax=Drosophila gunungcola TaxID=103775 RepID=A0A9P9YAX2_9MUSC|nr:hypothetical protein M5D96_013944 [Drosophila gunungcola]
MIRKARFYKKNGQGYALFLEDNRFFSFGRSYFQSKRSNCIEKSLKNSEIKKE